MNLSKRTISASALLEFKKLVIKISGCSFGEAASYCEVVDNYDKDKFEFNFTHGLLKGQIFKNSNDVVCIGNTLKVYDSQGNYVDVNSNDLLITLFLDWELEETLLQLVYNR